MKKTNPSFSQAYVGNEIDSSNQVDPLNRTITIELSTKVLSKAVRDIIEKGIEDGITRKHQ